MNNWRCSVDVAEPAKVWAYTFSRFYRIAQADIRDGLSIRLIGLFEHLMQQSRITNFCSRVVVTQQTTSHVLPDIQPLLERELPDWVRPQAQSAE